MREATAASGLAPMLEQEIPFPGLAEPRSQLAVPIQALGRLIGVLYVESAEEMHFGYDDEDALVAVAGQLGMAIRVLQAATDAADEPAGAGASESPAEGAGAPASAVVVRHFAENDSVFLDDGYLIKGVAGQIFWAIVNDYARRRRTDFSNRELRLDPRIRLPELADNLEARLILLERRLAERDACVRLDKTGRGRFRLRVNRPLELIDVPRPAH
jgi:adenylate cyclase